MLIDALPELTPICQLSRNEGEMRYVTQHFKDLQGLKLLPFAAGLLALLYKAPMIHPRVLVAVGAVGGVIALSVAWASFMTRWYRVRYGFVGVANVNRDQGPGYGLALVLCLVVAAGLVISNRKPSPSAGIFMISVSWLLPFCFFAVPRSGAVRLRRLLYTTAAVGLFGLAVVGAFQPRFRWAEMDLWLWSLLILGLYDHWLLGYLLRPRSLETAEAGDE